MEKSIAERESLNPISLWNIAIPLSQAALRFAPSTLRQEWKILRSKSAMQEGNEAIKHAAKGISWIDLLGVHLSGASTVLAPRAALLRRAENLLLSAIKESRVIGLGFEPPRQIASVPVHITANYWYETVRWDINEVQAGALKFLDVRVLTPDMAKPIILQNNAAKPKNVAPQQSALGRPSIQQHVKDAFHMLLSTGLINTNISARSHYVLIKQWIEENTSYQGTDLSDEGIRAHFSPLFNELKKNRKQ